MAVYGIDLGPPILHRARRRTSAARPFFGTWRAPTRRLRCLFETQDNVVVGATA